MAERKIGYGSPPKGRPFQKGQSGNPDGRRPRSPDQLGDSVQEVLNGHMEYSKNGKTLKAPRQEVSIKVWIDKALKEGDVEAAEMILKKRAHALKHARKSGRRVLVVNWLPDFAGQTGEQKAQNVRGGPANTAQTPSGDADEGEGPTANDEPSPGEGG